MASFPNEAFDLFVFSFTALRTLSAALGTEELPKWLLNEAVRAAASVENAAPSAFLVSAALGRGRGGRWQGRASLQGWTSLPASFRISPTSSGTQRLSKAWQSKCSSPSYYLLFSLLLWWVLPPAHVLPPLPDGNPKCREKAELKVLSWGRSSKAGFSHNEINLWSNQRSQLQ